MSIIKLNNRGVKNVTSFGSITSGGSMTFISKTTISSPVSSVQFTSGIDNTYKEYIFLLVNLHPNSNSEPDIKINFSSDGGSNYNVTKTTTAFYADHNESGSSSGLQYIGDVDLAQSTGGQFIGYNLEESDADSSLSGIVHLFNPSDTTFVKHFMINLNMMHLEPQSNNYYIAGYCNTTSAINAVNFTGEYSEGSSGNIDSGEIILYGIN
tara:strand:+ start:41 stop:670 length:630 start_codon:yes stop_codon:yes gene_type:complete